MKRFSYLTTNKANQSNIQHLIKMELNMESKVLIDHGKFYSYNGELYTKTFPTDWAVNQLPGTGTECTNCLHYGSWNGTFCMYCLDCARVYMGQRGGGVYGYVYEGECGYSKSPTAAVNTYLKDITLKNIGDWELQDCCEVFHVPNPDAKMGFMSFHDEEEPETETAEEVKVEYVENQQFEYRSY